MSVMLLRKRFIRETSCEEHLQQETYSIASWSMLGRFLSPLRCIEAVGTWADSQHGDFSVWRLGSQKGYLGCMCGVRGKKIAASNSVPHSLVLIRAEKNKATRFSVFCSLAVGCRRSFLLLCISVPTKPWMCTAVSLYLFLLCLSHLCTPSRAGYCFHCLHFSVPVGWKLRNH